jgi:uncharacterized protein GlcG (DUF336 family)
MEEGMAKGKVIQTWRGMLGRGAAGVGPGVVFAAALMAVGAAGPAAAQSLPVEKALPTGLALEAASAALETCQKQGYRVAVAVVDRAGITKVILRGDGTGPHTPETGRRKVSTSATMRASTTPVDERVRGNPALAGLRNIDQILPLGGGLPISAGNEVAGATGVSGAPGGNLDDACGQAGIDKIKDRLN